VQNKVDALISAREGSVGLQRMNRIKLVDRSVFLHSVACTMRIDGVKRVFVIYR
jgi:CMP-N-acetylneuraminic acid synthetase